MVIRVGSSPILHTKNRQVSIEACRFLLLHYYLETCRLGNSFGGSDNGDKLLKAVNKYIAKEKDSLTSQEWALWYKAVAENTKLGYWAETTIDGKAVLKVENNGAHKIVITGGTFENPSVSAIYTFHDTDEMNDAITELKELW